MSHPVHVEVVLRKEETTERLIRRFLRKVKKSKVLELRRRYDFYKKPSIKRKEKEEARQRVLRRLREQENNKEQRSSYRDERGRD